MQYLIYTQSPQFYNHPNHSNETKQQQIYTCRMQSHWLRAVHAITDLDLRVKIHIDAIHKLCKMFIKIPVSF